MTEQEIHEVLERLHTLERTVRRLKVLGVVALILVAAGLAMRRAMAAENVMRATRFEVVDADGKTRASLALGAGGEPALLLSDKDGELRAGLGVVRGQPALWLIDKDGKTRASLCVMDGEPALDLRDKDGKVRAWLILVDGDPRLALADKDKKPRAWLTLVDGDPRLALSDKDGKIRAVLGVAELETIKTGGTERTSPSSLVLFDKDGKVLYRAGE